MFVLDATLALLALVLMWLRHRVNTFAGRRAARTSDRAHFGLLQVASQNKKHDPANYG